MKRTRAYYNQLIKAHILGYRNGSEVLYKLRGFKGHYTKVPFNLAERVAKDLGADLKTLVLTYGLGREVITVQQMDKHIYISALPHQFSYRDAISIADKYGITARQVKSILVEDRFERVRFGVYRKVTNTPTNA